METLKVRIGNNLTIGEPGHIVVQTMCNTHTSDVEATVAQCRRLAAAGAEMIRITVPGMKDVPCIREIHEKLRSEGIETPLVADIHFSSETAIAVAGIVEKVRINPGNFHPDHEIARQKFAELTKVCRKNGTAIRIGLNHGSLGKYITDLYGNTPLAMAKAAMEWLRLCVENDFLQVVVSLKSSNTLVMVEAYRLLYGMMQEEGLIFPMHLGVTEAGNGDSGRIKSCIGIATLLEEGIGNTVRVSLTEDPEAEIPVARYLAERYSGLPVSMPPSRERVILDAACTYGPSLLMHRTDEIHLDTGFGREFDSYLEDEILQAARRRFYRPEYIACPGCGRTMYNLQAAFEEVKARTSHLKGMVIAVMGCIVNGPGEMADADWGYVGEGNGKVSIYKKNVPVARHVPESEAVEKLLAFIEVRQ
jgi:(E)-4-hydroxy-3-methylbut-2-enyl-diphosphate synthase